MTKRLLFASLGVLASGGIFSAVCAAVWPEHWPSWAVRTSSVVYLAGMLLLTAAVAWWLLHDDRGEA